MSSALAENPEPENTAEGAADENVQKHKVIVAVSQELEDLSKQHVALQNIIKPLLKSDALQMRHMVEIQNTDIVAQHLAELAKFLASYVKLCESGERDSVTAALNDVVLGALAERLSAICLGVNAEPAKKDPVEFF